MTIHRCPVCQSVMDIELEEPMGQILRCPFCGKRVTSDFRSGGVVVEDCVDGVYGGRKRIKVGKKIPNG